MFYLFRPLEKFHNKLEIETIQVVDAIKLDANHLIVVYKQQDDKIEKRIVRGPTIFVPNAHEWWVALNLVQIDNR